MITDEHVNEYMHGRCGELAHALNEITNWSFGAICKEGEFGIFPIHYGVIKRGTWLDIRGCQTLEEAAEYWESLGHDIHSVEPTVFWCGCSERDYEIAEELVDKVF